MAGSIFHLVAAVHLLSPRAASPPRSPRVRTAQMRTAQVRTGGGAIVVSTTSGTSTSRCLADQDQFCKGSFEEDLPGSRSGCQPAPGHGRVLRHTCP